MGCSNSAQSYGLPQPSSRAKVLCLHGGGSNRYEFSRQLAPVHAAMSALGGGPELIFLNGPLDAKGMPNEVYHDGADENGAVSAGRDPVGVGEQWRWSTGGHWRWAPGSPDKSEKYGGAEYLETWFVRATAEHGPFLGIMGFGEGGAVAALFAALARPGGAQPIKVPPLQCLVSLCAPRLWDLDEKGRAQELLVSQGQLPVMSLHIVGEADDLRPHIDDTVKLYKNPLVHYHQEGHRPLPDDEEEAEQFAKTIVGFLRLQARDCAFLPAEKR